MNDTMLCLLQIVYLYKLLSQENGRYVIFAQLRIMHADISYESAVKECDWSLISRINGNRNPACQRILNG